MRPYVGKSFHRDGTPSILLVGESHYFDDELPQRATSEAWYSGSSATLSEYDISFIHTAKLLEDATANSFPSKTHSIYSNPFWEINECGPGYPDYRLVAGHMAFYNFFLRPAIDGGSIKDDITDMDVAMANEVFLAHYEDLKPTAVVFLSMLAHEYCTASLPIIARHLLFRPGHGKRLESGLGPEERGGLFPRATSPCPKPTRSFGWQKLVKIRKGTLW